MWFEKKKKRARDNRKDEEEEKKKINRNVFRGNRTDDVTKKLNFLTTNVDDPWTRPRGSRAHGSSGVIVYIAFFPPFPLVSRKRPYKYIQDHAWTTGTGRDCRVVAYDEQRAMGIPISLGNILF